MNPLETQESIDPIGGDAREPMAPADHDRAELEPLGRRLAASATIDPARWERVRAALAARARAQGLVDVAVVRHDSPLGPLVLAATEAGLVRVGLPAEDEDAVLAELARRISPRVLRVERAPLERARRQLDAYFARRRRRFALPIDWRLATGFRRAVLGAAARIPYGATASYRELACAAGRPAAQRATGTALATNPLPIVIPCHRVVPAGGGLGGYRGGAQAKAALLALEGVALEGTS
ncbi:MAG TPA: methylated-DNA--[protein]-cysteine S-methyltransferase [Myxococcota bacterium]